MDEIQEELTQQSGEMPRAVVSDNNEPRPGGRLTLDEARMRDLGSRVRHQLMVKLATHGLQRPMQHDM